MEGNPTGCMGLADYLGWDWKSKAGLPIVNVPGCPVQPDNFMETLLYLLYQVAGLAPMIPLDDQLRPKWLFGTHGPRRLRPRRLLRAGHFADGVRLAQMHGEARLLGTGRQCNVGKRGWMAGIGGCPNVGGICIGCTMPGFPDKFMPFMDEPPGSARFPRPLSVVYGSRAIRSLRRITSDTVNKEPKWRHPGNVLTTGYTPFPSLRPAAVSTTRSASHGTTSDADRLVGSAARSPEQRSTSGTFNGRQRRIDMTTATSSETAADNEPSNLVEMSWDPITRIVGSLGIFTKIDFANEQVAECYSTSSIFRGYSIFMKGKDPRDAHFITSRICGICGDNHATCACYAQNMAFGVMPPALGEWIVNLGEAAEYMFDHNIFQDNLVGVDFCEQMVKETNPGVWEKAEKDRVAQCRRARLPDHRRHHAGAQSVHRRVLSRDAASQPHDAGDVLPDGRPARPSVDALSGRRRHRPHGAALHRLPRTADAVRRVHEEVPAAARRPVQLLVRGAARLRRGRPPPHPAGLLGFVPGPGRLRLPLPHDERVGQRDVRHARASWSTASSSRRTSSTSISAFAFCWAARTTTTGRTRRRSSSRIRWATRSISGIPGTRPPFPGRRSATSAASTPGSCRPAGSTSGRATTWPSTRAAAQSPGCGRRRWPARSTSATSRRPARA